MTFGSRLLGLRAFLSVAIVLSLIALFSASAHAGNYSVTQCDGAAGLDNWSSFSSGGWAAIPKCPGTVQLTAAGKAKGRYAGVRTPNLPAGLSIAKVRFTSKGRRVTNARPIARFCTAAEIGKPCSGIYPQRAVRYADKSYDVDMPWRGDGAGAKAFEIRIRSMRNRAARSRVYLKASDFRFEISDIVSPTASVRLDTSTDVLSGATEIEVGGSDVGGGIRRIEFAVDGGERTSLEQACDYSKFAPCQLNVTRVLPLDTTKLADGVHTIVVFVTDAGGNIGTASASFESFNAPQVEEPEEPQEVPTPSRPGPITYDQDGECSPIKNVSWTYTAGSDPVAPAAVRLTFTATRWDYDFENNTIDYTPVPETVIDLPFGEYPHGTPFLAWDTVALTGIDQVVSPSLTESASQYRYVMNVQIVNANGVAGPARSTSYVQSFCPE